MSTSTKEDNKYYILCDDNIIKTIDTKEEVISLFEAMKTFTNIPDNMFVKFKEQITKAKTFS
jgi:hypothetical protein